MLAGPPTPFDTQRTDSAFGEPENGIEIVL